MFNLFIATSSFGKLDDRPINILKNANLKITFNKTGEKINTLSNISMLRKFDGIIAGTEIYNKEILGELKSLKTISRLGVGLDNLDIHKINHASLGILSKGNLQNLMSDSDMFEEKNVFFLMKYIVVRCEQF